MRVTKSALPHDVEQVDAVVAEMRNRVVQRRADQRRKCRIAALVVRDDVAQDILAVRARLIVTRT